jgi:hypothetical protein
MAMAPTFAPPVARGWLHVVHGRRTVVDRRRRAVVRARCRLVIHGRRRRVDRRGLVVVHGARFGNANCNARQVDANRPTRAGIGRGCGEERAGRHSTNCGQFEKGGTIRITVGAPVRANTALAYLPNALGPSHVAGMKNVAKRNDGASPSKLTLPCHFEPAAPHSLSFSRRFSSPILKAVGEPVCPCAGSRAPSLEADSSGDEHAVHAVQDCSSGAGPQRSSRVCQMRSM